MRKLLFLICIGTLIQTDIAMAHGFICNEPLTVLSGNVECSLIDFQSDAIECNIVKFSHITYTFNETEEAVRSIGVNIPAYRTYRNGVPTEHYVRTAMTLACAESDQCLQAFDCAVPLIVTNEDGCHENPFNKEHHCHSITLPLRPVTFNDIFSFSGDHDFFRRP